MALTSVDLARMGPKAQKQVLQKLGAQQRPRDKRANKYHAKPTDVFMPDGTVRHFASEKEAARFRELDLLQRAGQITGLRCQVPFELIPWQERADYRLFIIKRKLMLMVHGIMIKEV